MLCAFCWFLVLPISLFSVRTRLFIIPSPCCLDVSPSDSDLPSGCFYSLSCISFCMSSISVLCYFLSFSPALCVCVSTLCDFPFSVFISLCSSFFSAFSLILTFEYFSFFMNLCHPLWFHAVFSPCIFCVCVCVCYCRCVCGKGDSQPLPNRCRLSPMKISIAELFLTPGCPLRW